MRSVFRPFLEIKGRIWFLMWFFGRLDLKNLTKLSFLNERHPEIGGGRFPTENEGSSYYLCHNMKVQGKNAMMGI